jgi:RNA polymerase sigma factor (sigma-70 family)
VTSQEIPIGRSLLFRAAEWAGAGYDSADAAAQRGKVRPGRTRAGMTGTQAHSQDDAVLPRVARGESGAVEACMDRYGGLVWTLARRMLSDRHAVEDAVQDIFVDIWRHADRFDPQAGSEATFIATITRRRLIDRLRKMGRQPGSRTIDESGGVVVAERIDVSRAPVLSEEAALARQVLSELSEDQQRVLQLSIFHGQSHEKIAAATGLPLGTVKTHARRGLIRIREAIARRRGHEHLAEVSS